MRDVTPMMKLGFVYFVILFQVCFKKALVKMNW